MFSFSLFSVSSATNFVTNDLRVYHNHSIFCPKTLIKRYSFGGDKGHYVSFGLGARDNFNP